jgi:hypothetical protein
VRIPDEREKILGRHLVVSCLGILGTVKGYGNIALLTELLALFLSHLFSRFKRNRAKLGHTYSSLNFMTAFGVSRNNALPTGACL